MYLVLVLTNTDQLIGRGRHIVAGKRTFLLALEKPRNHHTPSDIVNLRLQTAFQADEDNPDRTDLRALLWYRALYLRTLC